VSYRGVGCTQSKLRPRDPGSVRGLP